MPRTVAEIDAEIAGLKDAGVDMRTARGRALREERTAALAAPARASAPAESVSLAAAVAVDGEVVAAPAAPAFQADEWSFVEQVLAESEIVAGSSVVKNLYQTVKYKVGVWRILRDIVSSAGFGAEWPEWSDLHRDNYTGRKIEPKPVLRAVPAPAPATVAAPPATEVSELDRMKAAVRAQIGGEVDLRPVRTPEAAAV